jgi:cytochrome c-type protein NapB
MKMKIFVSSILCLFTSILLSDPIDQLNIGLGQDDVFSNATPSAFSYPEIKAGESKFLPVAYSTLPPQIPHTIKEYIPITAEDNGCLDCHDKLAKIGKTEHKSGKKIPMPKSHYGGFKGKGDKEEISGARYTCTQCHVPQSDAKPLIGNTYSGGTK